MHTIPISRPGPMGSLRTTQPDSVPHWGPMQGPGSTLSNEMQSIDPDTFISRSGNCRTPGDARQWLQRSEGLVHVQDKVMGTKTYLRKTPEGRIEAIQYHPHYDGYTACELTESNYRRILPQRGAMVSTKFGTSRHDDGDRHNLLSRELDIGSDGSDKPPQAGPLPSSGRREPPAIPHHVQRQLVPRQAQAVAKTPQNPFDASVSRISFEDAASRTPFEDAASRTPFEDSAGSIPFEDSASSIFQPIGSPYTAARQPSDATQRQGGALSRRLTAKVRAYDAVLVKSLPQGTPSHGTPPQAGSQQTLTGLRSSPRQPIPPNSPLTRHMAPQPGTTPSQMHQTVRPPFLKAWVRPMLRRVMDPSPQVSTQFSPRTIQPAAAALPRIRPPR